MISLPILFKNQKCARPPCQKHCSYRVLQNDDEAQQKILKMFNKALESSENNGKFRVKHSENRILMLYEKKYTAHTI